jgi:hypothetical protein
MAGYQPLVRRLQGGNILEVASGGLIRMLAGSQFDNASGVAGATIVVGAEDTNVRAITVQLTDASGADIAVRQMVLAFVIADANGDAFVTTGGSTGIAIGTDGALLALVAKKAFILISEVDGDIDLTWTDTGTEAAYLALLLPTGKMVISAAMTNT